MDPFKRKQKWGPRGTDAAGRKLCHCGCGKPVTPPRRTSHSDACVKNWKERNDPATIALVLLERDRGICALCGRDTEQLRRQCMRINRPAEPDVHEIAVGMGYQHAYDDHESGYGWCGRVRADVESAYETAMYFYGREVSLPWLCWQEELNRECANLGFPDVTRRWWEADHIVPVIEGGGGCGPEGYRTLCVPCHKAETAKLAARRAQKRRLAKQPELL